MKSLENAMKSSFPHEIPSFVSETPVLVRSVRPSPRPGRPRGVAQRAACLGHGACLGTGSEQDVWGFLVV